MKKKMRTGWFALIGIFSAFILLSVVSNLAVADSVKEIRICCQMPVDHFDSKAVELFIKKAEELSNKTLKFKYFPAGQLYNEMDLVDVLPSGGVEMAQIGLDRHVGRVPSGSFVCPYFAAPDAYYRWWYDTACGAGLYYKILKPAFAKDNMVLLSTLNYATTYAILTNKPVHTLEDYKGLRIRTAAKALGAVVEALGAKAVVMSSSDVYMALQRGTIDGALSGTSSFVSRKWYEVAKYMQLVPLGNVPFGFAANLDFWKSLSPAQQKAIQEATREMEIWSVQASMDEHERCLDIMKKGGVEVFDFPPEIDKEIAKRGLEAIGNIVKPDVGQATWDEAMTMLDKANKADKPGWKEMLEKRSF